MATSPSQQQLDAARDALTRSTEVHANPWRTAALAELEYMIAGSVTSTLVEVPEELTITSVQRGDQYAAVTVAGPVDARARRQLGNHLGDLIHAGTRHLVVDVSRLNQINHALFDLLRTVETQMSARGGVFELTGLTPPAMAAMDDEPLEEVFALYRASLEATEPYEGSWTRLRCPQGLSDVPEPRTPGRRRWIIDLGHHG